MTLAGVYRCEENGRAVYSERRTSDNCRPINVDGIPNQNVVSPGNLSFSANDVDLLHGRRIAKAELDRQTRAAMDPLSPEERTLLAQEAIANGEILPGMNAEQVVQSIGEPGSIEVQQTRTGEQERWYYWEGDAIQHHLVMRNGSVVYYYRKPSAQAQ